MGMYCCCGVKMRQGWICKCDCDGWFLCFESKNLPISVPIKEIPDENGTYKVRVFEDGDYHEIESEFSLIKKNWGQYTNQAISNWKIEYQDEWCGFRGVLAWKEN
jgi:hypothetical protein